MVYFLFQINATTGASGAYKRKLGALFVKVLCLCDIRLSGQFQDSVYLTDAPIKGSANRVVSAMTGTPVGGLAILPMAGYISKWV